jgi:diguanylate cyclase (GGDEF)-like protein/PAS domain S-box-containing protein
VSAAVVRVLLVDDDGDDVLITRSMLREIETTTYEVEAASGVAELDLLLRRGAHDVYLVDYRLGASNGLDVAQKILQRHPHAPVIMLTGMDDREVDVRAGELGIADYLVKGALDPRTLERSLRYAVKHQRALQALAQSEERYALALAGANDGLWDWDLRADSVYLSPRYKAMLGYQADELGSSPEEWFGLIHPDDRPQVEEAVRAHLDGETEHYEIEYRMRTAPGAHRWMLSRGLAVRAPDGRALRLAGSQTDVMDRKVAELQLQHDALHDSLTGLPNRMLFQDRLQHLVRRKLRTHGTSAVLFLDLDRFKIVNDSLGHLVGDGLLVDVADRLLKALRPGDTVARLGGDEFTVLLEDLADFEEAEEIADRVLETLERPFLVAEQELYLSASIGIAMVPPGATPDEVIRDADAAMYRAKSEGRNRHALFDSTLHQAALERLDVETRLRRGLGGDRIGSYGLHVAYQPIAHASTGRLHGFEALARWRDADGRTMTPDEFIPVAEETGMISALGRLVLREACRQLAEWRDAEPTARDLRMAVNISGRQLLEPAFADHVSAALRDHDIEPEALRLEITETAASADAVAVRVALEELAAVTGVRAHLDDFGTGAASLTVLRGFPGDALKIDRSFVDSMSTDPGALQIVRAVVGLAHDLGMSVVAEGVETEWQLELLRELRCEFAQGYLLARPLDPEAAGELLSVGVLDAA